MGFSRYFLEEELEPPFEPWFFMAFIDIFTSSLNYEHCALEYTIMKKCVRNKRLNFSFIFITFGLYAGG
jgi:Gpi18-like mannosyltransferase